MNLVLISPERDRSDEIGVVVELFAAGLERYHVRKPYSSAVDLAHWIGHVPPHWRDRLVLHQHHELVPRFQLGGLHFKDDIAEYPTSVVLPSTPGLILSRSCHDLSRLQSNLGRYDSVLFGPVFSSISKPGYGPCTDGLREEVGALLHSRTAERRRTKVFAIGGITAENAGRALDFGFDGVAILGAVWSAKDPIRAFREFIPQSIGSEERRMAPSAIHI